MMLPSPFKQSAYRKQVFVYAEVRLLPLGHEGKKALNDRRIVGASQILHSSGEAGQRYSKRGQLAQRHAGTCHTKSGQHLPASDPGKPPVKIITPEAFVTAVSGNSNCHM